MKILVIGSGGREHALCWKISQSSKVEKIFCAPGNAGTKKCCTNVDIKADDIQNLLNFAAKEKIDLTCVGPEIPLALGITDLFKQNNLNVFGPSKKASLLESSKIFAKNLMNKYDIPTADFNIFNSHKEALKFIEESNEPFVIKADGLAAGKGVFMCKDKKLAKKAIEDIMVKKIFGSSGDKIIIEEMLVGEEASILAVSDGKYFITLASSQDHKRMHDDDKGPNTGGMGAYSPASSVTEKLLKEISEKIIAPTIKAMSSEGIDYTGVLYAGIMVTEQGPKVLEYNVRFGDPETQAILPRMKSDLVELMLDSISGNLKNHVIKWADESSVCVVLSSEGYPGSYEKGKVVTGLNYFDDKKDTIAFHAGTKEEGGKILTSGGRVLNVVGIASAISNAAKTAYASIKHIKFEGMYFRKDIAQKAIRKAKNKIEV